MFFTFQELFDELKSSVAKIYPVKCDLTCKVEILKTFEWIETTIGQGVSIIINNAGTLIESQLLGAYIRIIYILKLSRSSSLKE